MAQSKSVIGRAALFTNDQTGAFSGCIASAPYKSGISVFVMVSTNVTWNLGFSHNSWSLSPGSVFPIVLTFDGRPPFNVNGRVISATGSSLTPTSGPSTPELQLEAMELASNFILKASLPNPRVLSRAETPPTLVNNGAAWKSDDAVGFVRIIPANDGVKGFRRGLCRGR